MLTPRENLLQLFRHQPSEWIPCCFHFGDYNIPAQLPPDLAHKQTDYLALAKNLGGDILYEVNPITSVDAPGITRNTRIQANQIIKEVHTPVGSLRSVTEVREIPPVAGEREDGMVSTGSASVRTVSEHFIKKAEDYRILRYIYEHTSHAINEQQIENALSAVGDSGVVVISGGPSSPLYNLINHNCGLERFVFDMEDHPGEVEALMEVIAEKHFEWHRLACAKSPAGLVRCTDDLDVKMISPQLYRQFAFPYLKQCADILHSNGKTFILHMCGHIKEFLPMIKEAGADAIHCLCPPPAGNTPLSYARSVLDGKVAMMVRPHARQIVSGSAEDVTEMTRKLLEQAYGAPGFMLCIPCGRAPLNNLQTILKTVRSYAGSGPVPCG